MDKPEEDQIELPPGFRFHPTDEELITHYLSKKVLDSGFIAKAIGEVDLNKCEPWDLPSMLYIAYLKHLYQLTTTFCLSNLNHCLVQREPKWERKSGTSSA